MRARTLLALVMLESLTAACGEPTEPAAPGWHVQAGALRDPDGRAVIMRGVNLSSRQKATPYIDDKQLADYARVRTEWGMNAVRFLMTWAAIEPVEGQYDDAYLDRVAERLAWARESGLLVVLDMHEDIYGEGFGFDGAPRWACDEARYAAFVPTDPWFLGAFDVNVQMCVDELYTTGRREQLIAAWRHVAERLAAEPAVVGFDVLNEPHWGTYSVLEFERDRLQAFYADTVAAVRAAAPGWVAFLEPGASRNAAVATTLTKFDFPDVVYAPHSYDTSAESGMGFDPANRQHIIDNVHDLAAEARALDAALWIGEYGGDAGKPGITEYMTAQYDAAGLVAGSTMYWAYDRDDGYGMLAPDGSEKPALLAALVRPYPERIAGTPISYAFDAATRTLTFDYRPDRALTAPTEVSVPARVYPDGYQVECGGCTFEQAPGQLVITAPPAGDSVTITVRP